MNPQAIGTLIGWMSKELAERYVGRALADAVAVYRTRIDHVQVQAWLKNSGLRTVPCANAACNAIWLNPETNPQNTQDRTRRSEVENRH
jgi:hypothetical protein